MEELTTFAAGVVIGVAGGIAGMSYALRRHVRRVRAAERRARSAERLAEIGAMTGGLAHEIKNPLSTIGLNAQLLAEAVDELDADQEARGRISRRIAALRREVERLKGILSDFLEYAGELRLERRPADLNQAVEELVDFYLPQAEKHGVRLRADLAAGPLAADLDVPQVKQALLNLMLNAVQAMHSAAASKSGAAAAVDRPLPVGAAGELILKTERAVDPGREPVVRVRVIDTGPGIPSEHLPRIFQPYFTTKTGGSGLGLPTTRRLIEAHGGRLDVHSEVGKGTEFVVTFPATPRPGADREERRRAGAATG